MKSSGLGMAYCSRNWQYGSNPWLLTVTTSWQKRRREEGGCTLTPSDPGATKTEMANGKTETQGRTERCTKRWRQTEKLSRARLAQRHLIPQGQIPSLASTPSTVRDLGRPTASCLKDWLPPPITSLRNGRKTCQSHSNFQRENASANHSVASLLVQVRYFWLQTRNHPEAALSFLECMLSNRHKSCPPFRLSELVKALCCFAETKGNAGGNLMPHRVRCLRKKSESHGGIHHWAPVPWKIRGASLQLLEPLSISRVTSWQGNWKNLQVGNLCWPRRVGYEHWIQALGIKWK